MSGAASNRRPPDPDHLLDVRNVTIALRRSGREMVTDVSLAVRPGELVGIVGESGSGKTLFTLTTFGLHEDAYVADGRVALNGQPVSQTAYRAEMKKRLGRDVAIIPQDPFSALNPSMRVGRQITEAIYLSKGLAPKSKTAMNSALELLAEVGIPEPETAFHQYPDQFSGGMRQRIVIAIALSQEPKLLIADEPTTALDSSTQRRIIDLIIDHSRKRNLAVILISHNLELLRQSMNRIAVLYSGQLLNVFESARLGRSELHPYTEALFNCIPTADRKLEDIKSIPGEPATAGFGRIGCAFAARCDFASDLCRTAPLPCNQAVDPEFSACLLNRGA